jgi:hypothetical protein
MKAFKRTLLLLLALALLTAAFFAPAASAASAVKDITLQPGSNESMMNFCWQSSSDGTPVVQVAVYDAASSRFPPDALSFTGTVTAATKGYFSNKVTVTGLQPETDYIYRVGNGTARSDIYSFTTGNGSQYSAVFVSDAQIGASGSVSADKSAWEKTLSAAMGKVPDARFLLSAGDQVDYFLESEYDAFLASPLLRQYPIAPAVGNHENLSKSPLHSYYYNEPNESAAYGVTPAGGDYWFRYGNTLYIVLNSSNTDVSQHDAFMAQAAASNTDARWRILMFHQSVYSSAQYATSSSTLTLRKNLVPVIDKYDIDVVLSGHDHCYTRTYQLLGGSAVSTQSDSQGLVLNPEGTVYFTANSSSGSKYYSLKATPEPYAAVRLQPKAPTFTEIGVTDTTLTLTTYRADTMAVIDTYALVKQTVSGFSDVPDGQWYSGAVAYLAENRLVDGTTETTFSPDMILTRAQCLVFVMKAYGLNPDTGFTDNFSDAGNTWYAGYLAAARRLGLVQGGGGNSFLPEANMTRQDMMVLLYNTLAFLDSLPAFGTPQSFSDSGAVAPYARNAVDMLTSIGAVTGSGGRISPVGLSTRAQMAQVLYRLLSQ